MTNAPNFRDKETKVQRAENEISTQTSMTLRPLLLNVMIICLTMRTLMTDMG